MDGPDAIPGPEYVAWAKAQTQALGLSAERAQNPPAKRVAQLASMFHEGQYLAVTERIRRELVTYPASFQLLNIAGMAQRKLGQFSKATDAFQKVAALLPGSAAPLNSLGVAFQEEGNLRAAARCFESAIELEPDLAGAHYNLGNLRRDQGAPEEALAAYRRAASLAPKNAEVFNNMANLFQDMGQPEDAVASYEQAVAARPDYAEAHYNMARSLKRQGRIDAAIAAHRRVLSLRPDHFNARVGLANALKEAGEMDKAIDTYAGVAFSEAPDLPAQARFDAVRNLLALPIGTLDRGMIDRLATRMKDVVRDQPVPSRTQFMRANLLAYQGKVAEAAKVFKEANAAKHSEISAEVAAESHSWQGTWDTPNPLPLAGRRPEDMPFEVLLLLGPTRSGKSSVEQALAGDASVLPRYEAINFGLLRAHAPEDLAKLPTEERGNLLRQALYLSRVTQDQLAGRIVVCTNPNLVHVVPALLALVGRLNIVWIDRGGPGHLADIFASDYVDGNFYAYDIDSITSYLSAYAKRMSELMKALPDQAIRVAFADFLNDPAAQIGRIAALIGRPLDQGGVPDPAAARRHCAYTEDLARHLL